jgi:hypothetical protein
MRVCVVGSAEVFGSASFFGVSYCHLRPLVQSLEQGVSVSPVISNCSVHLRVCIAL